MLDELALVCDSPDCDRSLDGSAHRLTMRTPGGTRHAYECACGAVTITVSRD